MSKRGNQSGGGSRNLDLSEDTVVQMVKAQESRNALQLEEIKLENRRIALEEKNIHLSKDHASQALEVESKDREEQRKFAAKRDSKILWATAFLAVLIFGLIAYCISLNKEDLIKDIILVLCGGGGGYGVSKAFRAKS